MKLNNTVLFSLSMICFGATAMATTTSMPETQLNAKFIMASEHDMTDENMDHHDNYQEDTHDENTNHDNQHHDGDNDHNNDTNHNNHQDADVEHQMDDEDY